MRKKHTVLLLLLAAICVGCSPAKDVQKSETSEDIFAQYPKTVIEQEESTGNVTVQLHHAAFEAERMVLDYTVKADHVEDYRYHEIYLTSNENNSAVCSLDCNLNYEYEEEQDTYHVTELYEWSGEKLQEKDYVNLEMYFMNMEATDSTVPSVSFEIKQPELFEPKQVDIAAKLSYKDTETTVQKLELSPFYTRLQAEAAFSDESYSYEITDETGTAAGFLGGNDNSFYYQGLPADCKKAGIAVIQYDQDAAYNRVSDVMEVELPESELK